MRDRFDALLDQRKQQSILRQRVCVDAVSATKIAVDGSEYINFSSNDYLGLSQHPDLVRAASNALRNGSGGSSLVTGYHRSHEKLEQQLCEWLGYESGLLFSSGFSANHGVLTALLAESDIVIQDKLNHASLIDGALHSKATLQRFRHNDLTHLEQRLKNADKRDSMIITEGVFSMDGDQAPVADFVDLGRQYSSLTMLDDAHGIGVFGSEGQGSSFGLTNKPDILVITFGKALGTSGACVLASYKVIQFLQQQCRHYIYSTAISPAMAEISSAAIKVCRQEGHLRESLFANIAFFRELAANEGLKVLPSQSAIQPIIIGDSENTLRISTQLKAKGFWVAAIRPPTVPENTSRLRVTLSASHSRDDIRALVEALSQLN